MDNYRGGITETVGKICEKIFKENTEEEVKINCQLRYNSKTYGRGLRNVVYNGLLFKDTVELESQSVSVQDQHEHGQLTVQEKLCVVCYKLRINGLDKKAEKLECLLSELECASNKQSSSTFTGQLPSILCETEAVLKALLALSNKEKLMMPDVCEVWRKTSSLKLINLPNSEQQSFQYNYNSRPDKTEQDLLAYEYFPRELFQAEPSFGLPNKSFEKETIPLNILFQPPGSGLTTLFVVKKGDAYMTQTRETLYNALVQSRTSDINVKLSFPDLPNNPSWFSVGNLLESDEVSEDEGLVADAGSSHERRSLASIDSAGVLDDLSIWDKALEYEPSHYHTWEARKKIISPPCKPYLTEAGPKMLDQLYDLRLHEALYLINAPPVSYQYLQTKDIIRDGLLVLVAVPSHTFLLEKTTSSFLVSPYIRLSGCSPDSLQRLLQSLAEAGTNYYCLNKFTTRQKHATLTQSSVLRSFIAGVQKYLQQYRRKVVFIKGTDVQSVLDLTARFKQEAYKLKFLADICMCSKGFSAEPGEARPKFPMGVKLLSYLYQLCLINTSSSVTNLLLFLLKLSCNPYLRFLKQWIFKGRCVDTQKEFLIHQNDVYLSSRDKYYWTNGYVMAAQTKLDGVPMFLEDLADDIFICGKSINLLKLCCPEHYICNHHVVLPMISVSYSLQYLATIRQGSENYQNNIKKLKEQKQVERENKENEEKSKREQALINERRKANKALAEMEELLQKSRDALIHKKREELDFLKQQMQDAIDRKILEKAAVDEEDAAIARTATLREVTTARLEERLMHEAREELLHYYELLTQESEKRERKAVWLQRRRALKQKREEFLKNEESSLTEMRAHMKVKLREQSRMAAITGDESRVTEQGRTVSKDSIDGTLHRDQSDSTVKNLIYKSGEEEASSVNVVSHGPQNKSTVQNLIYPNYGGGDDSMLAPQNVKESSSVDETLDDGSSVGPKRSEHEHDHTAEGSQEVLRKDRDRRSRSSGRHNLESSVEGLLYPTGYLNTTVSHTVRPQEQSLVQHLLYPSDNMAVAAPPSARGTTGHQSTAQDLLYPSGTASDPISSSTRGTSEHQSTAQDLLYPSGPISDPILPSTRGTSEYRSTAQDLLYPSGTISDPILPSTRGANEQENTVQDLLYPSRNTQTTASSLQTAAQNKSTVEDLYLTGSSNASTLKHGTTRGGREPQSTVQNILYDSSLEDTRSVTTRGHEPPSTIQNILYPEPTATKELPEEISRARLTHEDVWLAAHFQQLPDNFDVLYEEPRGDTFLQHLPHSTELDSFASDNDEISEDHNDACYALCLPAILQRCVMEPLKSQINIVNFATVRYFMDDLKLVEHFETLRQFLLMEDGEFSFSLSQQLFEKVSTGVTPQQLCSISTLNAIMAHAIQSSVYASQSNNTRSLSFILQSLPNIYKRNDIAFFDFIQLRYQIQWPVNIVITENCITKYNRIFSFMLRLKRTAWTLQDVRYFLKRIDRHAGNSAQLRRIHLFRYEMNHFVNEVQSYIANQILHVTWQEFLQSLEHNVRNLDDLHNCHTDYLNKALFRALLSKKAAPVMKIISDLLTMVLKFHTQLVSSSWSTDPATRDVVHPSFSLLSATHSKFKESTGFLFTVITKLVTRGYQPHLQELLLRLDFNGYYGLNANTSSS